MLITLSWIAGVSWYVVMLFMVFLLHGKQVELESKIDVILKAIDEDSAMIRIMQEQDKRGDIAQ